VLNAAELIRIKRDGGVLSPAQVQAFVDGLVNGEFNDAQAAAMAMAVLCRGMDAAETATLTRAMAHSGEVLSWASAHLHGPVLDKHSTGGVGDKVSLLLAPIVAACGGVVPMISGRGLGHTGGTLDKLEALPGYNVNPSRETLLRTLRQAGCAIVSASEQLAPADRRLYAIRDVTATVESLPLITASILSKKLAAGLQALVLDVKVGTGAFSSDISQARALARSLVTVAQDAGLPARALITDMNAVLGHTAGHALEVQEVIDYFAGRTREPRLHEVTLALSAELLHLGGLVTSVAAGRAHAEAVLASGQAAEKFTQMVALLGGPRDVLHQADLTVAPVVLDVLAPLAGVLTHINVRTVGLTVVALGGGRQQAGDHIDMRVGLSHVLAPGTVVQAGQPLARVHAATADAAKQAQRALLSALHVQAQAPQAPQAPEDPVASPVLERVSPPPGAPVARR
jgi:thymidine phosphorylase